MASHRKAGRPKSLLLGLPKGQSVPFEKREKTFWEQVDIKGPEECWVWRGTIFTATGYGRFCWNSQMGTAHRFAFLSKVGPIGPKLFVCHKCDVRLCVNPNHLFLGSALDNNHDMLSKGRDRAGRAIAGVKRANITVEQVRQIRAAHIFGKRGVKGVSKLLGLPYYSVKCALDPKRKWKNII